MQVDELSLFIQIAGSSTFFFPTYLMKKNLLLLAPMLFPAAAAAQGHYNIVYIMTDDHTAQMMSCYDNRFVETPNQIGRASCRERV